MLDFILGGVGIALLTNRFVASFTFIFGLLLYSLKVKSGAKICVTVLLVYFFVTSMRVCL